MNRIRALVAAVLLLSVPMLVLVGLARAQSFQTRNDTTVAQNQTIDGSVYRAGRTIDIAGTVNGDVYCAGQSITISGTVHGDVLCAGQTVDISGTVDGSVRVAGQAVNITGNIERNVSVAAQTFTTHLSATIRGDVSFASNATTLNGAVGRDVSGAGADVTVANQVGRNLKVSAQNITFTSSAKVLGNANYISNNAAAVDSGAQVNHLTHSKPSQPSRHHLVGAAFGFSVVWFLYLLLATLLSSLVLILLLPRFFQQVTDQAVKHLGLSILTGFLAGIAVFVLFVALMVSIIGIPLGLLLLTVWFVILAVSLPVTAYYIGRIIWAKANNPILIMLLGTLILVVLLFLPIIGILVAIISVWIGTGSLLRYFKGHYPRPVYKV